MARRAARSHLLVSAGESFLPVLPGGQQNRVQRVLVLQGCEQQGKSSPCLWGIYAASKTNVLGEIVFCFFFLSTSEPFFEPVI